MQTKSRFLNTILQKRKLLETIFASFSKKEWVIFSILFVALIISTISLLWLVNEKFITTVPAIGGTMTEGVVGTPRFVNPVLAISDADKDITALVYSGLLRKSPDGQLIPDLAKEYTVSDDGLIYTFTLKDDIYFHDDTPVTADDIVYTITLAKDPILKSPKRVNWDGITIEKKDDKTIIFKLKQRYASFLDNATIGILPAHLWKDLTPDQISLSNLNMQAIGSGPYEIKTVKRTSSGIPQYYALDAFKKFALGRPYLSHFVVNFYANEKDLVSALQNGSIEGISAIGPDQASKLKEEGITIKTTNLPRVFGLFFNQNQAPIFTDRTIVSAFDMAIDKEKIIKEVLGGYGTAIDSPIPPHLLSTEELTAPSGTDQSSGPQVETAKAMLDKDGWVVGDDGIREKTNKKKKVTKLAFSIATSDAPELKNAALAVEHDLEAIGVSVDVKVFEMGTLNQNIIRPRKYDALFFGQVINHETDLLAFWHSSQRNDPGLNIALYANAKADKYLEDASGTLDPKKRSDLLLSFEQEVKNDMPAIFVYSPDFIYALNTKTQGIIINKITIPSDRLSSVYTWYKNTDRIWKIFLHQE